MGELLNHLIAEAGDKAEAIKEHLKSLTDEELVELEERAREYYAQVKARKAVKAIEQHKIRNRADLKPEGAAAARRRKQAERRNGNQA